MSNSLRIKIGSDELGPYPFEKIERLADRGGFADGGSFWSETKQGWMPIAGVLFEIYPPRIADMKCAGIRRVKVLTSGTKRDCKSCRTLAKTTYDIDSVPELPPVDCSCKPWCMLTIVAVE